MKKVVIVILLILGCNIQGKAASIQNSSPDFIKIATIGITIYRNQEYSEEVWQQIIEKINFFETSAFSIRLLKEVIDYIYEMSLTNEDIWGGVSVSYIKDAQKISQMKKAK